MMWQLSVICVVFSLIYTQAVCDTKGSTPTPKTTKHVQIIGGHDIDIKEAPYQVSIVYDGDRCCCGGSIISKDIILTAAQCVYKWGVSELQVRVGSSDWASGGLIVPIANKTCHSNFSLDTVDYDVGLIKLSTPLEFSDTVKPIDIMEAGQEIDDEAIVNVTGWGVKSEDDVKYPKVLQKVSVQKVNDQVCRSAYSKVDANVTPRMLCTGVPAGGKNPCYGDGGSPLVYNGKVVGLVSWGYHCATPVYPAVYAKISALRTWIDDNIKLLTGEAAI